MTFSILILMRQKIISFPSERMGYIGAGRCHNGVGGIERGSVTNIIYKSSPALELWGG